MKVYLIKASAPVKYRVICPIDLLKKGHVKKEALSMVNGLACAADGMLMYESMLEDFSLQVELKKYIDNFIALVEV